MQVRVPVAETVFPQLVTTYFVPQNVFKAGVYEDGVQQALFTQILGALQVRVPVFGIVVSQLVYTSFVPQNVFKAGVYEDGVHPHTFGVPPPPHV